MGDIVIGASRLIGTPDDESGPGWVVVRDERIAAAGRGDPPHRPDVVLDDGIVVPGLLDAQINGAFAVDFAEAGPDDVRSIAVRMLATGVTSMVPTFITAPLDELVRQVEAYDVSRRASNAAGGATRLLPAHVEGPFLSARRRGAHRQDLLVDPTPERIATLTALADCLSYVTLAPERDGAIEAIRSLVAAGIRVAIGHSDASDHQVIAAADAGATLVTHLYNAQRPLHHRAPGVVGAALTDPRLTLGLIVDGHHVEPTAVRLAFSAARGRVMLVTDAASALGMPPGSYELGGEQIVVTAGAPPLRADGTIAGADEPLDANIGHAVADGIDVVDAVRAATRIPADALGLRDVGRLEPGARADLTLLGTDDLRARTTWLGGRQVWGADSGTADTRMANT
ncbi:N-acetylglucosamine-6-phosphate deacetylase [Aeromicrobium sp.]|uniref:N-acetylglucosamine-6-phosphate deacetylase n=1 Tax=Aeromicrobium sp. TaxID=1871063 RepID=UPI00199ED30A|nr:N-acetylglucosamine-6-phosphate deacetylase [Aeromicrobium sp.]MBC7632730.1 N-acetylglucosamine-6-phosphate deacetylase [Aeromicrobium sp.]